MLQGIYKTAIKKVRDHFEFTDEEMDKPINSWDHDKYDLFDPNSQIVKALMLIYSMEPPFYGRLNWICR